MFTFSGSDDWFLKDNTLNLPSCLVDMKMIPGDQKDDFKLLHLSLHLLDFNAVQ